MQHWYEQGDDKLLLRILVQPKASRDEIAGVQGDALKIRITAPPVDGKANKHLIAYLAKTFGLPKTRLQLLSGESSRKKLIAIPLPAKIPQNIQQLMAATDNAEK